MNVAPGSNLSSAAFSNGSAVGFANEGYWGMDVKVQTYTGSFWVKGAYDGVFTASLQSNLTGEVFGSVDIQSRATADEWVEHEVELVPSADAPNSNNTFAITFDPQVRRAWTMSRCSTRRLGQMLMLQLSGVDGRVPRL